MRRSISWRRSFRAPVKGAGSPGTGPRSWRGEELLKEMVESGSVLTRRNVKLPQESKIPYPENQEVKYIEQRFSKKKALRHKDQQGPGPRGPRGLRQGLGQAGDPGQPEPHLQAEQGQAGAL